MHWLVTSLPGWLNHPFRVGSSQSRGWPPTKLFPLEPFVRRANDRDFFIRIGRDSSEVADISPGSRTATSQALVVFLKPSPILQASSFNSIRACTDLLVISTPLATSCGNCCNTCERIGQEQVWNHRSGLIPLPAYSIP